MAFPGPLDEHKRAGADRIGNQVLCHLLSDDFSEISSPLTWLINTANSGSNYPPIVVIRHFDDSALYVHSPKQKQASRLLIQISGMRKKAINYTHPGLKTGLFFGLMDFSL